jgi:predicted HicB family RNase H-like nuclease
MTIVEHLEKFIKRYYNGNKKQSNQATTSKGIKFNYEEKNQEVTFSVETKWFLQNSGCIVIVPRKCISKKFKLRLKYSVQKYFLTSRHGN